MAHIKLDQITAGMILSADVKEASGRLLLSAGSEITERHIAIFRKWGISEIEVDRGDRTEAPVKKFEDYSAEEQDAARARADRLFSLTDKSSSLITELHRINIIRFLSRGEQQ